MLHTLIATDGWPMLGVGAALIVLVVIDIVSSALARRRTKRLRYVRALAQIEAIRDAAIRRMLEIAEDDRA